MLYNAPAALSSNFFFPAVGSSFLKLSRSRWGFPRQLTPLRATPTEEGEGFRRPQGRASQIAPPPLWAQHPSRLHRTGRSGHARTLARGRPQRQRQRRRARCRVRGGGWSRLGRRAERCRRDGAPLCLQWPLRLLLRQLPKAATSAPSLRSAPVQRRREPLRRPLRSRLRHSCRCCSRPQRRLPERRVGCSYPHPQEQTSLSKWLRSGRRRRSEAPMEAPHHVQLQLPRRRQWRARHRPLRLRSHSGPLLGPLRQSPFQERFLRRRICLRRNPLGWGRLVPPPPLPPRRLRRCRAHLQPGSRLRLQLCKTKGASWALLSRPQPLLLCSQSLPPWKGGLARLKHAQPQLRVPLKGISPSPLRVAARRKPPPLRHYRLSPASQLLAQAGRRRRPRAPGPALASIPRLLGGSLPNPRISPRPPPPLLPPPSLDRHRHQQRKASAAALQLPPPPPPPPPPPLALMPVPLLLKQSQRPHFQRRKCPLRQKRRRPLFRQGTYPSA